MRAAGPTEMEPARDARNREAMEAHGLDGLICRLPENVLLLTGYLLTVIGSFNPDVPA